MRMTSRNAMYSAINAFINAGKEQGVNEMRPYLNDKGEPCIVVNKDGKTYVMAANDALLRYDEWKDVDRVVLEVAVQRLAGIADLQSRGLTHNLGSLGVTLSQWEMSSDMTDANVSMSGITAGEEDTEAFKTVAVPVPIIHKDFRLNIRRLEASRRNGEGLDVTQASIASRLVAEASEDMLFTGNSIVVDGHPIYGYFNFPYRNVVEMATGWDQVAQADNATILAEVQAMMQASRAARMYGPWTLYIPGKYQFKIDEDYRALDSRTLGQRLLALDGLSNIRISDRIEGDNVTLVQMTRDTVDLAIARDVSTIQWMVQGGMIEHFKVMACWVPRLKRDFEGRCGITHLTTST